MRGLGGREQVYSWRESIDGAMIHHVREDKRQAVSVLPLPVLSIGIETKYLDPMICVVLLRKLVCTHPPTFPVVFVVQILYLKICCTSRMSI